MSEERFNHSLIHVGMNVPLTITCPFSLSKFVNDVLNQRTPLRSAIC